MLRTSYAVAAITAIATLTACEGEAVIPPPGEPGPTNQLTIDATAANDFVHLDLSTGQIVNVASPSTSSDWDIAIRRYEIRINGGPHGPGGASAATVIDNAQLPSATILGFDPENRLPQFEEVDASDIPGTGAFVSSILVEDLNGWFSPAGQSIVANPAKAWKIRLASGGHALFRVAAITVEGRALTGLTLEYRMQQGATLGPVETMTVAAGPISNPTRISFTSGGTVTTGGCTWDVDITVALAMNVNAAGCDAGTYPVPIGTAFTEVATAADAPRYVGHLAAVSGPIPYSIAAADGPPFIYGLDATNPNRLIPSYNVYLVKKGAAVYKVQFLSYYNPVGGASGFVTLRSARIQ